MLLQLKTHPQLPLRNGKRMSSDHNSTMIWFQFLLGLSPWGFHPWAPAMMLILKACFHLKPLAFRVFLTTILFPHKPTLPWTHTNKIISVKPLLTRLLNSDITNTPHTCCLVYFLLNLCFRNKRFLFFWAFDIPVFNRHPINIGSINKRLWVITLLSSKHHVCDWDIELGGSGWIS